MVEILKEKVIEQSLNPVEVVEAGEVASEEL
jgi:hypothetical protein